MVELWVWGLVLGAYALGLTVQDLGYLGFKNDFAQIVRTLRGLGRNRIRILGAFCKTCHVFERVKWGTLAVPHNMLLLLDPMSADTFSDYVNVTSRTPGSWVTLSPRLARCVKRVK